MKEIYVRLLNVADVILDEPQRGCLIDLADEPSSGNLNRDIDVMGKPIDIHRRLSERVC